MSTLEVAHDDIRPLVNDNDLVSFPSGHRCSISTLATQMFYPVFKVPQLHIQCSHCNHTIIINSNHVSRLMHVATGSISQILENHMCYQSQQVCSDCDAPLKTTIHFNDTHKIYAVDVTLSRVVKIQGSTRATTLHRRCLVYYGGFHFTCQMIDEAGNIWFHDGMTTARTTIKEGRIGSVSEPDLKQCRNKQLCLVLNIWTQFMNDT